MAEPPPPPFQVDVSEAARDDLSREPDLVKSANGVLLRAANELKSQLDMGQNVARDVHGKREAVTVRVSLVPPDQVRIEGITPGDIVPEDAIVV